MKAYSAITARISIGSRGDMILIFDGPSGEHVLCVDATCAKRAAAHADGYALRNDHDMAARRRFAHAAVEIFKDADAAEIRYIEATNKGVYYHANA